jgi:hypothetical protein
VYLSVDALVNRGRLDLVGALLEANTALEGLSPDALKARKARQAAERQQAAAAGGRQIRQIGRCAGRCVRCKQKQHCQHSVSKQAVAALSCVQCCKSCPALLPIDVSAASKALQNHRRDQLISRRPMSHMQAFTTMNMDASVTFCDR